MKVQVEIEKLAYGGAGVGKVAGKVVFVEGALPGETVEAVVTHDKKSYILSTLHKLIKSSPHRLIPPCDYIVKCGGCQYQHATYAEELRGKDIQVRDHLTRNLNLSPALIAPIVASPSEYNYRNSISLHRDLKSKDQTVGFYAKNNKTILPIETCLLADEKLNPLFAQGHKFAKKRSSLSYRLSEEGKIISTNKDVFFDILVGGTRIRTHAKSFFQNNLFITGVVGEKIKHWLEASQAKTFLDLYSGVGTFTRLAAAGAKKVVCIESNAYSIEALRENLKALQAKAEILEGEVEKVFPEWLKKADLQKGTVFLDPPRKGMAKIVTGVLAESDKIDQIIYLSCHLGTLTRDLNALIEKGHYAVKEVISLDMFPRTKHIEILALLQKTPAAVA